jgi:hypothetical protein
MSRPELDTLLDQYGLTREMLDDSDNNVWIDSIVPTYDLVSMITWRYVEQGKVEYRIAEDGVEEFRYIGE